MNASRGRVREGFTDQSINAAPGKCLAHCKLDHVTKPLMLVHKGPPLLPHNTPTCTGCPCHWGLAVSKDTAPTPEAIERAVVLRAGPDEP